MFEDYYRNRKNTESVWNPCDTLANYKPVNAYGRNYAINGFSYKFNSYGYRSDEFTEISDFPIMFMGCSYTEGVGLPISDLWVSHFVRALKAAHPDYRIPLWNFGLGGTGIDRAARTLVEFAPIIKPKYVIYLLSTMHRREFVFGDNFLQQWVPNQRNSKDRPEFQLIERLFSDEYYALHQTYLSLLLLQQTAKLSNTKVLIFDLMFDLDNDEKKKQLFSGAENVEYFRLYPYKFTNKNTINAIPIPESMSYLRTRPILARDSMHPGSVWQYEIFRQIWEQVKDKMINMGR